MRRGISFEIPNEYGKFLWEILEPVDVAAFDWRIGSGETYRVVNDQLDKELFLDDKNVIEGRRLKNLLDVNKYYIIFADLQAFPKNRVARVETFEEFLESSCELVLLVVDCSYATIYCKNQETIESIHNNAITWGFESIEYITAENDPRTRLSVW
ncbi:uncharacterized protein DUF2691 [Planomicrobium soli]|uniref:Uncharacterized protein DUF2691 n=1 Tax=Planomicrobium soli TaxID=1176648 RepID=A0A2P8GQR0_9BACL|nr:DUF2691 family protein [Planomicrobium soli]PSL36292.1 uncharacterized protein DUF2691 [Planomicrobium soli]